MHLYTYIYTLHIYTYHISIKTAMLGFHVNFLKARRLCHFRSPHGLVVLLASLKLTSRICLTHVNLYTYVVEVPEVSHHWCLLMLVLFFLSIHTVGTRTTTWQGDHHSPSVAIHPWRTELVSSTAHLKRRSAGQPLNSIKLEMSSDDDKPMTHYTQITITKKIFEFLTNQ